MAENINSPAVENTYDESSIQVLEGLEAVRKRPGMYIGSTGERGLHHLVYEIVDNSIDEALAGYCDKITVELLDDGIVRVTDNGRGIPVGINPQKGIPTVTVVFTILHAGGKFGGGGYKVSGGLHGVGASVVNALSSWLEVEVSDGKNVHRQRYEKGNIVTELEIIGETEETGTVVTFKPDPTIFTDTTIYDFEILEKRLREQAFLNAGIRIVLTDKRKDMDGRTEEFFYEGGIRSYVDFLLEKTKGESLNKEVIYLSTEVDDQTAEIAMVWSTKDTKIMSFANTLYTVDGGTHEQGFKMALGNAVNKYAFDFKHLKEGNKRLKGDDICEGLVAVVSVKLSDAQFESQTKAKLGNTSIGKVVRDMVNDQLYHFLEENPVEAKKIITKIIAYSNAREAAQAALEASLKKAGVAGVKARMPEKLSDCISKDPTKTEIFIVEGDSAGGSAVEGRNSTYQAILPLWGKMLNVEKARDDKVYGNDKLMPVIVALGTGIGENFDIEKLRYDKIVIMADADVDGSHIRTLLLTFFFRYMPELIETGHIYLAQPPLYRVSKGKKHYDAFTDEEKAQYIEELGGSADVQRYKGLGEMDPEQLWETTLDPKVRTMLKVTMADAELADQTFSMLMGDEVEPRKIFIEENAVFATDLDI
ncbi:MAG: DNA topoisomerase (ATP-hydrolyzing) subunit B [Clostridia bacterium]|nr:DNA topoisomerase (ATP-hydrolyzing) subunit B [Clostridia bacterium]MBQ3562873.1 DNA topoisomerase (ATP-hydrolyzing) subunit B [Clostridia bacterium]